VSGCQDRLVKWLYAPYVAAFLIHWLLVRVQDGPPTNTGMKRRSACLSPAPRALATRQRPGGVCRGEEASPGRALNLGAWRTRCMRPDSQGQSSTTSVNADQERATLDARAGADPSQGSNAQAFLCRRSLAQWSPSAPSRWASYNGRCDTPRDVAPPTRASFLRTSRRSRQSAAWRPHRVEGGSSNQHAQPQETNPPKSSHRRRPSRRHRCPP
jgi:hypothetical protein